MIAFRAGAPEPIVTVDPNPDREFMREVVSNDPEAAQLHGPVEINDIASSVTAGTVLGTITNVDAQTFYRFAVASIDRDPRSIGEQGAFWGSKVAAVTTEDDPIDGVTFEGWVDGETGLASAFIERDHEVNGAKGDMTDILT